MEYYLQQNRNGVLTCATIWMNLEHMRLSERSQTESTTYRAIAHT